MGEVEDEATDTAAQMSSKEEEQAAQLIQRNYRGYRERRQLRGLGLDASDRWAEVGSTLGYDSTCILTRRRLYAMVSYSSPHQCLKIRAC